MMKGICNFAYISYYFYYDADAASMPYLAITGSTGTPKASTAIVPKHIKTSYLDILKDALLCATGTVTYPNVRIFEIVTFII